MKYFRLVLSCLLLLSAVPSRAQVPLSPDPSRVLGHLGLTPTTLAPNLVEGRELNEPQSVAVDTSSSPPRLYVADTRNNRVLGWRAASGFDNGAFADVVIGQRNLTTTLAAGPGTSLTVGLNQPTGLAVDAQGNLYVVDTGNNRILRFSRPFQQPDDLKLPDLVIGQANMNSRVANSGGLSDRSVSTLGRVSGRDVPFRTGLVFDSQGNLYFTDSGNNRVLRYPAVLLGPTAANGPAADMVLGQPDFVTATLVSLSAQNRIGKDRLRQPSSVAVDQAGRIFVSDSLNRVLVYVPPLQSGMFAARVMGVVVVPQGAPQPPVINETSLGLALSNPTTFLPPEGVFTIGNIPFVVDTPANRILRYDRFEDWPAESFSFSPPARAVIGQDSLTQNPGQIELQDIVANRSVFVNRGRSQPGDNTFFRPVASAYGAGEVFVVDSANNRVLAFPDLSTGPVASSSTPYVARRIIGQFGSDLGARNLLEGREFFFSDEDAVAGAGVVVDTNSNPPRLYVADTNNNRVLGFADARRVRAGDRAAIVIGQPDFLRSLRNYPTNSGTPNESGLSSPAGVAVDSAGNLYVADTGNGRVLRFPRPFSQPAGLQRADLVIGQANFTSRTTVATARNMGLPWGLAFTQEGHLLVSDAGHSRVLLFLLPFSNGMDASKVFGQPNFDTDTTGTTPNKMNSPRHIAADTDDRLYACDAGNNRVLVFSRVTTALADPTPVFTLSRLGSPQGIFVSSTTGEIWVADTRGNRALRYPKFDTLVIRGDSSDFSVPASGPLALAQDAGGNLFIADSLNRIAIHFPGLAAVNGASYVARVAPGMLTSLFRLSEAFRFADQEANFNQLPQPIPLPTELADTQVLIDNVPARLYFVSPAQINFLMPMNAPTTGFVEIQVVRPSLGQILASSRVRMDVASPALFSTDFTGAGQVAALNQDNTLNSASNPIPRGQVIQLFGTGQGFVPGAPPDGTPPSGAVPTVGQLRVLVNSRFLEPADIQYTGLAPGLVGLWQINIRIPDFVPPSPSVVVVLLMNDIRSNEMRSNGTEARTTIAVRQ